MMEPNVPLLRKVVEWVEEQDRLTVGREWYQGWFVRFGVRDRYVAGFGHVEFCDTAYCVAGKVALDGGWTAEDDSGYVWKDGQSRSVADVASELLGIPDWDPMASVEHLFDGGNDAEDIRRIAEGYAGERL